MATTPLPNPPFLVVPGVPNLRDLGGYPTPLLRPGHVTRGGLVFRAAAPSATSGPALSALSVADIYDLRSGVELEAKPGPPPAEGLRQHHVPVFADTAYTPEAIALRFSAYGSESPAEGFSRAYGEMLAEAGAAAFGPVLAHLARPDPAPLLVHCTAGKDRTGVACALVLSLCGVPDEVVAWEYNLTEIGLEEMKGPFTQALMKHPAFKGNPEGALRMLGAKTESMLKTLKVLRAKYGSVEEYVQKECGLSDKDIAQLRENMVVDASTVDKSALPVLPNF
ncbi:Tyrosine-protein phosphatase [Paramyrothecium foliicola]|nr:Tyrosine-protein phosphatase [Paramyrothecium foliicola]